MSDGGTLPVCDEDGPECLQADVVYVQLLGAQGGPGDVMSQGGVHSHTSQAQVAPWSSAVVGDTRTGAAAIENTSL